jgi:hypothetical protein
VLRDVLVSARESVCVVPRGKFIEFDGNAAFRIRHGRLPPEQVATVHADARRARYFSQAPSHNRGLVSMGLHA